MASSAKDTIETAALGRPFGLGMLYDCRKDALIPGITLWNHDELQKNTLERKQQNTEFNITASDSIDEKSNSLKVSGSLKLSLLGGLVNVGGSAKYFQDTKKSLKQQRLTLQYKTTTKYETLSMSHLGRGKVSHPNVFEDDIATHVVTAILYGATAYFVFDRESSKDDEKKQVEGEAKLMMSNLKFLTVQTEASFITDEKQQSAVKNFSCTFHGDFHLSNNPTSFSEAVHVYTQLPKMLGKNGELAVPVRVWLYPLVKLDAKATKLQKHISNNLITYSSGIIEHLNKTEMRCNDLLKETAATTFSGMEKKLQTLIHNCRHYKLEFVQKLGSVLPSIRGGRQQESALEDILKAHEKSPFNSKELDQWLTQKEKESDTLKSFLEDLKVGAKMHDNLEYLLSKTSIKNIVSFSFTSIDQPDSFLIKLSNFLKPAGMVHEYPESDNLQNRKTDWLSANARKSIKGQLKLFQQLEKLTNSDDTIFTVTSKYDERYPGVCIVIYEDGCDEPVPFIPPSKPAPPTISDVSYDGLTVGVSDPDSATVEYRVEIRMKQETEWTSHPVQKNQKKVALSALKPDTEYEIKATAVGKLSYAVSSDAVTAVTKAISPPTNVKVTEVKANSITLTWSTPEQCEYVKQYIIEFKEESSSDWKKEETKTVVCTFTLKSLKENTTYLIRMCADAGNGMSKHGKMLKAKTWKGPLDKNRFAPLLGNPPVYLLKMKSETVGQFNKMVFGKQSLKNPSHKTIMLVGATGSGKTTLINGMVNFILGTEWEDKWRFKLIDEESNKSQAHSQTSEVTAYQIHHTGELSNKVPYSLTIIDTPGFGDTRGIKQDKEITERIRQFFKNKNGIDAIDAVCFVVQAALARLTHTQKYIFNAIFSVFGKNIANNIITLVTFADDQHPPVLEAIKEANIPCATDTDGSPIHFKFNNSALFANNTGGSSNKGNFNYMFWTMGEDSMKEFFTQLGTMETQSLTLTKEVLQDRKQLETTVEGVQPLIRKGLSTMEEIRATKAALDKHKMKIQENKDFEYEVVVEKSEKFDIPTGTFITNCQTCNFTCHYPCLYPDDTDKGRCCAIISGNCTVCPGKCEWSVHCNMTYKWEVKREKEKRTYQDLKTKFEEALGEKISTEKVMAQLTVEYHQVQGKLIEMMATVTKCLQRLKEIALRPDPLATTDYIDLLIQSEEQEARPGFKQRIRELQEVREGAFLVQKVAEKVALSGEEQSKFEMIKSKAKTVFNEFVSLFK